MVLTGNVVLVQDKNVVQGDKLTIDTKTNHSTLVSNAQGRGAGKRVRGVFYPSQNTAQNQGAPAARP
jgi:lipopolysaccharide export system protein LptA